MKFWLAILAISFSAQSWSLSNFSVYGEDDRREIFEEKDSQILQLSKSVAARIHKKYLRKLLPGERNILDQRSPNGKMCPGEKFVKQETIASCAGVLIAQDKILTANHCIPDQKACDDYRFVFDYKMKDKASLDKAYENKKNIYQCKTILKFSSKNAFDYSIIQLDRAVSTERKPITFSREKLEIQKDELITIGFPSGLGMKVADNGYVFEYTDKGYFTNLDTFAGNSGSPVFKKSTGQLMGILLSGKQDYFFDKENKCLRINKCDSNGLNCDIQEPWMEEVLSTENIPTF